MAFCFMKQQPCSCQCRKPVYIPSDSEEETRGKIASPAINGSGPPTKRNNFTEGSLDYTVEGEEVGGKKKKRTYTSTEIHK
eukprot:UN25245